MNTQGVGIAQYLIIELPIWRVANFIEILWRVANAHFIYGIFIVAIRAAMKQPLESKDSVY